MTGERHTRWAPSPLAGEGWGEGYARRSELAVYPPPCPSPARGEGTQESPPPARVTNCVVVANISFHADCAGALYWPDESLLIVADLHLEKGSSLARRGMLLPPYDTAATLARFARLIAHYAPRRVIALGDSFHDGDGPARLSASDRVTLSLLQRGRDWVWIAGNHDPDPTGGIGGTFASTLSLGALTFRHEPSRNAPEGEIAGHLHPVARIAQRGRAVSRRCFATDGKRMVMPAFGAYAGGLNVRDRAFLGVFGARKFTAHMLGERRLYAFAASRCLAD